VSATAERRRRDRRTAHSSGAVRRWDGRIVGDALGAAPILEHPRFMRGVQSTSPWRPCAAPTTCPSHRRTTPAS